MRVAAVEVEDDVVAGQDQGASRAVLVHDMEVGVGPKDAPARRVEAIGAERPEVQVHPVLFHHARGRGIAVQRVDPLRVALGSQRHGAQEPAVATIHAEREELDLLQQREGLVAGVGLEAPLHVLRSRLGLDGGRQPNAIAVDEGRRPTAPLKLATPRDVGSLGPFDRQAARVLGGVPLPARPSPFGPFQSRRRHDRGEKNPQ